MNFDIDKQTAGEWFPFFGSEVLEDGTIRYFLPNQEAGKFQIRQATVEILDIIKKETQGTRRVDFVPNPKTRQMERVVSFDQTPEQEKKEREMLWDYIIMGWEGIKDGKENEIAVTTENKMKLLNIPVFMRFLSRCLEILGGQSEATEKN